MGYKVSSDAYFYICNAKEVDEGFHGKMLFDEVLIHYEVRTDYLEDDIQKMIDLQPGSILKFKKDEAITCEVYNENKVKFRDEITSLSNAAEIILREMGYDWSAYQGPRWWMFEGKTLSEIRREV